MTQDQAFSLLTMGKNVFLTGAAGSGKTYVLNRFRTWLAERGIEAAVTASTGIAATHIGGQTIHSWSGIGVRDQLDKYDLDRLEQNERLIKRFRSTKVLIIDEVSMLSANTLALVDQSLQVGLQSSEPFGGLQVVLCGDFFQLPPIVKGSRDAVFAFEGDSWRSLKPHVCYLSKQHRQSDELLLSLLNSIRGGHVPAEERAALEARLLEEAPEDIPSLYTHNVDVDQLNNERLAALPGGPRNFEMRTKGSKKYVEVLKRGMLVPETLQLKEGAVVMFVKNDMQGKYVNGTLGTVTGFSASNDPIVEKHDGDTLTVEPESWKLEEGDTVRAEVIQMPLRLAWAVTVHKSQGMTLDAARIDLSKTFVPGQGYVALSRLRTLAGLYLEGINDMVYACHPRVAAADEHFQKISESLVGRLKKTPKERLATLSGQYVQHMGGHAPRPVKKKEMKTKGSTYEKTRVLVAKQMPLAQMAVEREMTAETILSHLERLQGEGRVERDELEYLMPAVEDYQSVLDEIQEAFEKEGDLKLSPVRKRLKNKYSYEELRLARLFIER